MKRKNIKKITALMLVAAMAFATCACGSDKEAANAELESTTETVAETTEVAGPIELTVGTWPSKETEADKYDLYNQYKDEFEAKNKNVKIVQDEWKFDLQTFWPKAAAGQLPDIYMTYFTEIGKVVDNGYAADLTEAFKNKGYYDLLNPAILSAISVDGKIYGIPTDTYEFGLVINTEMFEAAGLMNEDGTPQQPKDWYELAEFAKKIKDATGKIGLVLTTTNNQGGWVFSNIAWSFGVDFMEEQEDGTWKATFDCEEMVEAVEWVKSLKWEYDVLSDNLLIDGAERNKLYGTEEAAICISSSGITGSLTQFGFDFDKFGLVAMPAGPARHVALLGGNVYVMANTATQEEIEAAIDWMDHIGRGYAFSKEKIDDEVRVALENGQAVGANSLSTWSKDSELMQYKAKVTEENANINLNHVKLYNDALNDPTVEVQGEEPVCCQELYAILDGVIQEVLTNENADVAALVSQANEDFQTNYLDNM